MAKTTKKRTVKRVARKSSADPLSLLSSNSKGVWGKDQPMVLILSSGIIILIVLTLMLNGWL